MSAILEFLHFRESVSYWYRRRSCRRCVGERSSPTAKLCFALSLLVCTLCAQQPASNPDALLQQGIALHQAGDVDGAVRAYREFLTAQPDSLQARSNLGAVLARAGRYDEAIAEYNLGLRGNPDNAALLLNLGLAYYKTGRHAEAAARFERALSIAPQFSGTGNPAARLLL